jgi:hypothetical protein
LARTDAKETEIGRIEDQLSTLILERGLEARFSSEQIHGSNPAVISPSFSMGPVPRASKSSLETSLSVRRFHN